MTPFKRISNAVFLLYLTFNLFCNGSSAQPAPNPGAQEAGVPGMAGTAPEKQVEKDWIDNRWQATDVGPFLCSILQTPHGTIAKAISIKLNPQGNVSIAYDMNRCSPLISWTNGFLKFSPTRFGLIDAPKMEGSKFFDFHKESTWGKSEVEWKSIRLSAGGVVLEYKVDGCSILEKPVYTNLNGAVSLARHFWISPHSKPISFRTVGDDLIKSVSVSDSIRGLDIIPIDPESMPFVQISTSGIALDKFPASKGAVIVLPASDKPSLISVAYYKRVDQNQSQSHQVFASPESEDPQTTFNQWTTPSLRRWKPDLETRGQRGLDTDFLSVDTLTIPYRNPWNTLFFGSGIDFTENGNGYFATIHGDVWQVSGIDEGLQSLTWKRFATGLFQPLGLKVRHNQVFVIGRDRISKLIDLNSDGEADVYESFFDGIDTSTGGHDYVTCLEVDQSGRFYYTDPKGVHRVAANGNSKETLATGWRNPNGLGVSPDGSIVTVAPQQGTWTPSSEISEVRLGGYYGYGGPRSTPERTLGYDPHLLWLPHSVDNSSGSQVWIPSEHWGPFGGKMFHLIWGKCQMGLVLRDTTASVSQGAFIPLPAKFLSGPNRGTFNSRDKALYVAGSTGWQTSASKDGALQRVRLNPNKPLSIPISWKTVDGGIELTFTQKLDPGTANDPGSYAVKRWNYRYSKEYGSKDWSVTNPEMEGRDDVEVHSTKLSKDGYTLTFKLSDMRPAMQMEIRYNLALVTGRTIRGQLWLTLNHIGKP